MKPWAEAFYKSQQWKACRASYMKKCGGLCERCLRDGMYTPAVIVHHKEWLTQENIHDPKVTLSFKNLECLCAFHHNEEHNGQRKKRRYSIDRQGKVTINE